MKSKKVKLCAILLLVLGLTGVQAQEAISASGGDASGSGGSVSYSIGQLFYTTNTGTNGSVAQGVQQPYEISVIGIEEGKDITLQCSAYPNPTKDYVKLEVKNYKTENLTYQIYDNNGRYLESKKIDGEETFINMKTFMPAIYFLKVINNNNKEIKTFKIIKN